MMTTAAMKVKKPKTDRGHDTAESLRVRKKAFCVKGPQRKKIGLY
jgi:hypothetical protein